MKAPKLFKIFRCMIALAFLLLCQGIIAQSLDPELQDKYNEAQLKIKKSDFKGAYPLLLEVVKKSDHIASLKMLGDINKDYYKNYSAALTYYKKVQAIIKSKLVLLDSESNKSEILTLKTISDICKSSEQECLSKGANQIQTTSSSGDDSWGEGGGTVATNTAPPAASDDFLFGNEGSNPPPQENPVIGNDEQQPSTGGAWDTPTNQGAVQQSQGNDAWGNPTPQAVQPSTPANDAEQQVPQVQTQNDAWGNQISTQTQTQQDEPVKSSDAPPVPEQGQQQTDAWGDPIANPSPAVVTEPRRTTSSPSKESIKESSNNFSEENGVFTIKDENVSFKFFEQGQVTSYTIFARSEYPGFRLPSPKELKTILKAAKENKDGYNLFEKFQWEDRNIVHFLTSDKFTDTNNEQKVKSYMFMKHNYEFEESSVEWGEMVSIILIRE